MRVGLNISTACGNLAGIGNYAFRLAKHLPIVGPDEEWIFFGSDSRFTSALARENARVFAREPGIPRILWEQAVLPSAARKANPELLHGTDFGRPLVCGREAINTLHDLSPFADSTFFPWTKRVYKKALISLVARRDPAVITVSSFSRAEIIERFQIKPERVFAIPLGTDTANTSRRATEDPPRLLFVGTLENRKNVARLIEVFGILRSRRSIRHRLVLAGQPGYGWETIQSAIKQSGAASYVDIPGYVSHSELLDLYGSAAVFVYPSFYEGFGLPVIEAMAHGLPVVCSRATSLPEVGGNAAIYFDPYDVEEMVAAIERVIDSPSLQSEMRERGLRQAAKFTWEECARKHLAVYRTVLGR